MAKPIWKQINSKLILSTTCSFLINIFHYSRATGDILKPNTFILFLMLHTKQEHLFGTTRTTEKTNAFSFVVPFPSLKTKSSSQLGKHLGIFSALPSWRFTKTILLLSWSFKVIPKLHTENVFSSGLNGSPLVWNLTQKMSILLPFVPRCCRYAAGIPSIRGISERPRPPRAHHTLTWLNCCHLLLTHQENKHDCKKQSTGARWRSCQYLFGSNKYQNKNLQ